MYSLPFKNGDKIIELGGGQNPMFRPNLDVRACPEVDIVGDINKPLPLKSNEWDGIFCRYAIEHISWRNVRSFIKETHRILAPGGVAVFVAPDLLEQARILTETPNLEDKWVCMVFGDNDYDENAHRCGFSPEFAGRVFREAGFERVTVIRHPEWRGDMIIEAQKSTMTTEELFDKEYFNGGKKVGGYAFEGYRDFPVHWITAQKILDLKPKSVLELGCARGYVLKRIEDQGIPSTGLEISEHCLLTRAAQNIFRWNICNTPWPFEDKQFDVCYSIAVMEHVPEEYLEDVLGEINRVSKRGLHGVDFGENDDGFDQTHCTLREKSWWDERMPKGQVACDKESLERYEGSIITHVPVGDNKLKLNIGSCTIMFHNGWINTDVLPLEDFARSEGYKFLRHDARTRFPFEDGSVDLIYSAHFLEHLTYSEGRSFLEECNRLLVPGGTARITVPDLKLLVSEYNLHMMSQFDEINNDCAATKSNAAKFWQLVFNGHRAAYDWPTLCEMAKEVGFQANLRSFRQGHPQILAETLDVLPCLSLYVELVKS